MRVFNELHSQRVMLEGMILKPNMVLSGSACRRQAGVDEVADATVERLLRSVPAAVPGIAFLSGGQSAELASARLNAMNVRFKSRLPWAVAFSFAPGDPTAGLGDLARPEKRTCQRHSRPYLIAPDATGLRGAANTMPRWKTRPG